MNIGFVGIILGEKEIKMKTCILKNASEENLLRLIDYNIQTLDKALDYLIENDIQLFRISSDFIPFGSHEVNKIKWWEIFERPLLEIGKKAKDHHIRLSTHPGQYTIINSQNENLTQRSIADLEYHTKVLDSLGLPASHKLILHIGGVYGDKEKAMERFVENYKTLPINIKHRLIIENDDRNYTAEDVLKISKETGAPVVFDYLHYLLNHDKDNTDCKEMILRCRETWKSSDGTQKIHYSQQATGKRLGSHSETIDPTEFYDLTKILPEKIDVMFEVKDKNLSVLKYREFIKNTPQN